MAQDSNWAQRNGVANCINSKLPFACVRKQGVIMSLFAVRSARYAMLTDPMSEISVLL